MFIKYKSNFQFYKYEEKNMEIITTYKHIIQNIQKYSTKTDSLEKCKPLRYKDYKRKTSNIRLPHKWPNCITWEITNAGLPTSMELWGSLWDLNHWPWGIWLKFQISNFLKINSVIDGWCISWYCPHVIITGPHWWLVNIGSGNGLVPSGNKPLPEPMLTQIYVAKWHHQASMN